MTVIHTVLGERPVDGTGRVLPHEHLVLDYTRVIADTNLVLNDVALAVDELVPFTAAGGSILVDLTPRDLGRGPTALREISLSSGVDVVMGTGWYHRRFYPADIDCTPTAALADGMIAELLDGVAVEGAPAVPAGIIGEIGADTGYLTAAEERVLRAAGRASAATGAAVSTHSPMTPVGLAQLDILLESGASPDRIVIGHADTYLEPDYHRELLRRGVYVQFDTIARTHLNPDDRRASALVGLIRDGWLERLLISSDRCFRSDLLAFGGAGYAVTFTAFADRLRGLGVSDEEIDVLTITNPRRMLAW
jgi:phosphotriesterase-related protein